MARKKKTRRNYTNTSRYIKEKRDVWLTMRNPE